MMATVPHVTSGLGLKKFQANGFLFTRVYNACLVQGWLEYLNNMMKTQNWKILCSEYSHCVTEVIGNVTVTFLQLISEVLCLEQIII